MYTWPSFGGGGGREVASWTTIVVVKGDVVRVIGETKFANENLYDNQPKLACLNEGEGHRIRHLFHI